jgi:hypothetical protein|eukprot:COSAG01_NODE_1901_length_8963_cov_106.596458_5_plen_112_part_00
MTVRLNNPKPWRRFAALPDDVELCGNHASQNQQVGNLVPPPLAAAVGRELIDAALAPASDGADADAAFPPPHDWHWRAAEAMAAVSDRSRHHLAALSLSSPTCSNVFESLQ